MLFTQYMMPDGRREKVLTECPKGFEDAYVKAHNAGVFFDIEVLSNGMVSMTAERDDDTGTQILAHELCQNDPNLVPAAVKKLMETLSANFAAL